MPTITLRPANGPLSVTEIDCGASNPKLGGTINISPFNNLTTFIKRAREFGLTQKFYSVFWVKSEDVVNALDEYYLDNIIYLKK